MSLASPRLCRTPTPSRTSSAATAPSAAPSTVHLITSPNRVRVEMPTAQAPDRASPASTTGCFVSCSAACVLKCSNHAISQSPRRGVVGRRSLGRSGHRLPALQAHRPGSGLVDLGVASGDVGSLRCSRSRAWPSSRSRSTTACSRIASCCSGAAVTGRSRPLLRAPAPADSAGSGVRAEHDDMVRRRWSAAHLLAGSGACPNP